MDITAPHLRVARRGGVSRLRAVADNNTCGHSLHLLCAFRPCTAAITAALQLAWRACRPVAMKRCCRRERVRVWRCRAPQAPPRIAATLCCAPRGAARVSKIPPPPAPPTPQHHVGHTLIGPRHQAQHHADTHSTSRSNTETTNHGVPPFEAAVAALGFHEQPLQDQRRPGSSLHRAASPVFDQQQQQQQRQRQQRPECCDARGFCGRQANGAPQRGSRHRELEHRGARSWPGDKRAGTVGAGRGASMESAGGGIMREPPLCALERAHDAAALRCAARRVAVLPARESQPAAVSRDTSSFLPLTHSPPFPPTTQPPANNRSGRCTRRSSSTPRSRRTRAASACSCASPRRAAPARRS